ncbi:PRAME family member 12-like, partial [Mus pahari]|uniref:PRAME family member 12-like n=1 Tax=Mus pahari TaxID=10093 RepID=UPI000A30CB6B
RPKLQVLDMRNVHHTFWKIWSDEKDSDCNADSLDEKQEVKVPRRYALRQRLKITIDLAISSQLNESNAYFLNWAKQRKGSVNFCCTKMKIWDAPDQVIRAIFEVFDPEHITELELYTDWTLLRLAHFAPYFGKMKNLKKFFLAPLHKNTSPIMNITRASEVKCIKKIISQFSKINCLQHFFMKRVRFLRDHLNQVLGCLRTPLETLSITHCLISQTDLNSISCCRNLFKLKHLEIRVVMLYAFDITPLRGLLGKVAGTLESLDFQWCTMKDYQLNVLLPALSQCSQLKQINFYSNDFSMAILKDLLQHTANWSKMNVEQYPAPLECYDELGQVSRERFVQLCHELMDTLRAIRQPRSISFSTNVCLNCGKTCVYGQGVRLCSCLQ